MSTTLANIEYELAVARRLGPFLAAAGLDATYAGTSAPNVDLRAPIREGLQSAGFSTADPIAVTDDDVSGLAGNSLQQVLDVAEQRVLASADRAMGARGVDPKDPRRMALRDALADATRTADLNYGDSTASLSAGSVGLGFASRRLWGR